MLRHGNRGMQRENWTERLLFRSVHRRLCRARVSPSYLLTTADGTELLAGSPPNRRLLCSVTPSLSLINYCKEFDECECFLFPVLISTQSVLRPLLTITSSPFNAAIKFLRTTLTDKIFLLGILLLEPWISLMYAWKPNKCNNCSFRLLIIYGISYMFRYYIAIINKLNE
jgi:hypothetical protein